MAPEKKPDVLIVDDTALGDDISEMLLNLGYRVSGTATNPPGAFRKVVQGAPDLVLINIGLRTTFDGIETADFIFHCLHTPVIFLATHIGPDTLEQARKADPIGHVIWPCAEASLGVAIEEAYNSFLMNNPDLEERRTALLSMMARDDAYLLTGKDGGIIFMNWFACRFTGWGYEEAFLRPLPAVLVMKGRSPSLRFGRMTLLNDIHNAALLDRPSVVRVNTRDGRTRTARLRVGRITDRDGTEVGHLLRLKEILEMRV